MATVKDIIENLRSEIEYTFDGYFDLEDGTHITYNKCNNPRFPNCYYCSVIRRNGYKLPTIIVNPKTAKAYDNETGEEVDWRDWVKS